MPLKRWRLDEKGRIVEVTPAMERFFGEPAEALKGRYCWEVVQGVDDFGRPVCQRCPVIARLARGAYEAEVPIKVRGQRMRCHGLALQEGFQIVLDERRRPRLGEVLYSLAWATQRMGEAPMRFFQTLELFLSKLRRAVGMEAAELFIADPEHRHLILTAVDAENKSAFLERAWFEIGEGYPGIVALERAPLVTHELERDTRYLRQKVKEAGYHTYLVYPLETPRGVIGVLNLASKDPAADERAALELLEAVAPVLASGIYAALTALGERQLIELLRRGPREAGAVVEELLRAAIAFSGASAAVFRDREGRRAAVPASLPPACQRVDCGVWRGEPMAVKSGGKPCPYVEGGRPRYCLPVVVDGEVVAMETLFFARVPRPATRAMAPLLWMQRLAWQAIQARPGRAPEKPPARLVVRALGALRVQLDGTALPADQLKTLPWRLFKLFLAHPERPLSLEEVAEALWPEANPERAVKRVPRVVHELRRRLEESGAVALARVDGGYLLRFEESYDYDVERFERAIRDGDGASGEVALGHYLEALDLYAGDFLADEPYATWAEAERTYLRAQAIRAGERAGELLAEAGRAQEAESVYRKLLQIDPEDPYLLERLAEVLTAAGKAEEAKTVARRLDELLAAG